MTSPETRRKPQVFEPDDPRLEDLMLELRTAPDANGLPEWIAGSLRADVWTKLLTRVPSVREQLGL